MTNYFDSWVEKAEREAQDAVHKIKDLANAMPAKWGLIVLMFPHGKVGQTTYISTAQREEAINVLKEFLEKLESIKVNQ